MDCLASLADVFVFPWSRVGVRAYQDRQKRSGCLAIAVEKCSGSPAARLPFQACRCRDCDGACREGRAQWCTELVSIVGVSQGMRSSLDVAALLKQGIEGLVGVRQHAMGQHFAVPLLPHAARRRPGRAVSVWVRSCVEERPQPGDPQEQHERLTLREGAEAETPVERRRLFVEGLDNRCLRTRAAPRQQSIGP